MADLDVDLGQVGTGESFSDDVSWETNGDGRTLVSASVVRNDSAKDDVSVTTEAWGGTFTVKSFPKIQYSYKNQTTGEVITSSDWRPKDPDAKSMFDFKMNEPHDKDFFVQINYLVYDKEGGDAEEDAITYSILYKKNVHNFIGEYWAKELQSYFGSA